MARGRFVSKAISLDEKVNALSDDTARLLFTWLITHLDCEGRMHGDPVTVKSIIFPRRNISHRKIENYLKELEKNELIFRYSVNGNQYLLMKTFEKHQPGLRKDKESASQIPPFTPELGRSEDGNGLTQVKVKVKDKDKEGEGGMGETDRDDLYKILEATKGFPKYTQDNVWKLEDVMKDYPGLNYLLEFKKFREYWNTRQLKRPFLALRNWLGKAKERDGQTGKTKSRGLPARESYTRGPDYGDD